jgi:hypothetical protein
MSELAAWEARKALGKGRVRPTCTIAPNTVAWRDTATAGPAYVYVTFHGVDIFCFRDEGMGEVLTDYNSYTTRERINRYMPSGWYVYQTKGEAWVKHYGSALMLPMGPGIMVGWDTSEVEHLIVGVRLGKADAREALAAWFAAKGWVAMASAVRNLPEKPYGYGTKALAAQYGACVAHEDCREHPELGKACKEDQRKRALIPPFPDTLPSLT